MPEGLLFAGFPKVTLLTPDTHQAKTHPSILIEDSRLPLVKCPTIYQYPPYQLTSTTTRVSNRNNILKALAGTSLGQQKETLLVTYKVVGRSIINYALRIATGCHKMSSIDHLHTEAEMLKVREHSEILSAQYL